MRIFFLIITILLVSPAFSQNPEKAELEKKKRQTLQEIEQLNRQYDEIKKNRKESLSQLALIQNKIRLRNQVIQNINKQVRVINKDIDYSYREMLRLRRDLDTLKMNYALNVVYSYKNRSNYDFLNFLFSASNFNDAIRRIAYTRAYRAYRTQQVDAIRKTETLYRDKINQLRDNRQEKTLALEDETKERTELEKDRNEQDHVVRKLKSREKEVNKIIAAKRKQANELEAAIKAVVRREIEMAKREAERKAKEEKDRKAREEKERIGKEKEVKPKSGVEEKPVVKKEVPEKKQESYLEYNKEDLELGNNFESNRGRLPFPVDNGYVSIPFGEYTVPGTNIKGSQDFITIASPVGTAVKSVFDGEVVSIFDVGGMSAVMIKHGKYFTTYSNLSSAQVSKGQTIKVGQVLGRVGENLEGDGQLDFILTREAQMLNPQSWLRGR
ncbi:MAG: peptidoglycan DD-metalloendopeptidase family protein [Bacteroidota bacterium]|jgi:septal ring factor EnvC (AmiA/AmiB activator)